MNAFLTWPGSVTQDIRKAEKLRRELELRAEEALNEAAKEKKAREKVEASKAAENSSSASEQSQSNNIISSSEGQGDAKVSSLTEEISRLKSELESHEIHSQETLINTQVWSLIQKATFYSCRYLDYFSETKQKLKNSKVNSSPLADTY